MVNTDCKLIKIRLYCGWGNGGLSSFSGAPVLRPIALSTSITMSNANQARGSIWKRARGKTLCSTQKLRPAWLGLDCFAHNRLAERFAGHDGT